MDLKELDLVYRNDTPLGKTQVMRNIIYDALVKERCPNSHDPFFGRRRVFRQRRENIFDRIKREPSLEFDSRSSECNGLSKDLQSQCTQPTVQGDEMNETGNSLNFQSQNSFEFNKTLQGTGGECLSNKSQDDTSQSDDNDGDELDFYSVSAGSVKPKSGCDFDLIMNSAHVQEIQNNDKNYTSTDRHLQYSNRSHFDKNQKESVSSQEENRKHKINWNHNSYRRTNREESPIRQGLKRVNDHESELKETHTPQLDQKACRMCVKTDPYASGEDLACSINDRCPLCGKLWDEAKDGIYTTKVPYLNSAKKVKSIPNFSCRDEPTLHEPASVTDLGKCSEPALASVLDLGKCSEEHVTDGTKREDKAYQDVGQGHCPPEIHSETKELYKSESPVSVEIGKIGVKEMESMISVLVEANQYFREFPRTHDPKKQSLLQAQMNYLKLKQAAKSNAEAKAEIRRQVLEQSVKYIEIRISESVRFAKRIPGFRDLPIEDQANLIRESRTESAIVGGMRGINADKQVFTTFNGAFYSMDDMKLVFDETLLIEKIKLSTKIARLNMTPEEEAILRAITITATDRCELQSRDRVEDIQKRLVSCLLYVLEKRDPITAGRRFGQLTDVLCSCRYVTEVDMKQVKKIFLEWPKFSDYKLVEEFL